MRHFLLQYRYLLLFVLLMGGIGLAYNYWEIFGNAPCSTHQWRQSDSASMALNYYQNNLDFFAPRMHYIMGGEGRVAGAGEAPIFYYFVAIAYSILGPHEGLFRLLSWLTFVLGLYFIGRLVLKETQDWAIALFIPALVMSSPVIGFYAFNFTPNIPGQGLSMLGIWFFYSYAKQQKLRQFYLSMLFFMLAGLIKISALIPFVAIGAMVCIEQLRPLLFKSAHPVFKHRWVLLPGFISVIGAVLLWKYWAEAYNTLHRTGYFLASTRSYWSIEPDQRLYVFNNIVRKWFHDFSYPLTLQSIKILGLAALLTPFWQNRFTYLSLLLISVGSLAFYLLWFRQFEHHDYYVIEMVLLPVVILFSFFSILKKRLPKLVQSWIFRLVLLAILIANVVYAQDRIQWRYQPEEVFMRHFNPSLLKTTALRNFLKEHGIQYPTKVVSVPDQSPNNSLYALNLMGWTELYLGRDMFADKVKAHAREGAQYLIISEDRYLKAEDMQAVLTYPVATFDNSVHIFDLRPFVEKKND